MAQRVTLRKRQPYNTTSNRRRVVKTPGGKLVYHHLKKLGTAPKCGDCGIALPGVRLLCPPSSNEPVESDDSLFVVSVRSLPFDRESIPEYPSARKRCAGRMVARGAETVSSLGTWTR